MNEAIPAVFQSRLNLSAFIEANKGRLQPPVSNFMLYNGNQLKVMIVGGPNQRDDFHVERGEEMFYQVAGPMNLDVMQMGKRMRLPIKEGDIFVLPAGVPHSPQRYENTIGLVIERTRTPDELDFVQWYVPGTNRLLYRETLHCTDLGTQIKAVIERFNASENGKRMAALRAGVRIEEADHVALERCTPTESEPLIHTILPMPFQELVEKNWKRGYSPFANLVDSEFVLNVYKGQLRSEAGVYYPIESASEVFLMQIDGSSEISCGPDNTKNFVKLAMGDVMLLPPPLGADRYQVRKNRKCELMVVTTTKVY